MFWFWATAIGGFYGFWRATAPKKSEVTQQQAVVAQRKALADAKREADARARANPHADQPTETLRGVDPAAEEVDGGASSESEQRLPYDPANNPFNETPSPDGEGKFRGSFDDLGIPEDTPLEEYDGVDVDEIGGG